jgi:hypothetical protein
LGADACGWGVVSEGTARWLFRGRREVAVPRHGWRRGCEIRGGRGDSQQNRDCRGGSEAVRCQDAMRGMRTAGISRRLLRRAGLAEAVAGGICGRWRGTSRRLLRPAGVREAVAGAGGLLGAGAAAGVGCVSCGRACGSLARAGRRRRAGAGAVYTAPLIVSRD